MKLEMQQNEFEGKLITFCGLDGCGKTTQIRRLVEWLESNGHKVYLTKQPSDFVRNSEIFRTYMDSPTHDAFDYRALSLLCASDRVQHSNRVISQKLKEGYIVISDKPDVAFFLNITVDEAIRRVRERPEEKDRYIDIELQKKLHDLYVSIARENGGVVISTLMPEETCFKRVVFEVEKVLNSK